MSLTYERVRELFNYDPETGVVTRRVRRPGARGSKGSVVGTRISGYYTTCIDGRHYRLHRVIWLWVYGYIPEHVIDHENRIKDDNRLTNLREVTQVCNTKNRGVNKSNGTGIKGISRSSTGTYEARINNNKISTYLGKYKDMAEAVCHRLAAEQCLGWPDCDSRSTAFIFVQSHVRGV